MLFMKYRNEIKELKNEIEKLRSKTETLYKSLNEQKNYNNTINQLSRIIGKYIPGKITYMNCSEYRNNMYFRDVFCYIYKDGREHEINNLRLENATFEEKSDDVIIAKNWVTKDGQKSEKYEEYVIDLYTKSFVRIK